MQSSSSSSPSNTLCTLMPKAELHLHLEGTFEPDLVRKIAKRNNLPLPSSFTTRTEGYDFHDLSSFLSIYYANMSILQTKQDFFDLAWNYLSKIHTQNILHVEMFFDPQAHTSRGIEFSVVIEGYHEAIQKAEEEFGLSALLIMCFLRDMDSDSAMTTLNQSLPYKDWIVGVGLDSDERDNPPIKFQEVFKKAKEQGYRLTMHCDVDQKNSIEHIRQALHVIQVERLDHGTNILEDSELVDYIKEKGIGLTCCPISNSVCCVDFKGREILSLLRKNIKTTINSDDPAYFRGYMNENMIKMQNDTDVTKAELVQFQRNAFTIAWIPKYKRDKYLAILDEFEASQ